MKIWLVTFIDKTGERTPHAFLSKRRAEKEAAAYCLDAAQQSWPDEDVLSVLEYHGAAKRYAELLKVYSEASNTEDCRILLERIPIK
jgi:hypothetical protein